MTKKSKSTYELLFETFKDVAREKDIEIKVETIRTNFEKAAINVLELNAAFSIHAKPIGERFRILVYAKHTLKTLHSP